MIEKYDIEDILGRILDIIYYIGFEKCEGGDTWEDLIEFKYKKDYISIDVENNMIYFTYIEDNRFKNYINNIYYDSYMKIMEVFNILYKKEMRKYKISKMLE